MPVVNKQNKKGNWQNLTISIWHSDSKRTLKHVTKFVFYLLRYSFKNWWYSSCSYTYFLLHLSKKKNTLFKDKRTHNIKSTRALLNCSCCFFRWLVLCGVEVDGPAPPLLPVECCIFRLLDLTSKYSCRKHILKLSLEKKVQMHHT